MRSASTVPARMEPITKAPRAAENPLLTEKITIRKHRPMAMTSSNSSLMKRLMRLKMLGSTKMPTVNQMMRKNDNLRMLRSISSPLTVLLIAMDDRITMSTTAKRSSTMSTAKVMGTNRRLVMFKSVSALRIMVVDDIEIMPPRKMLSMVPKCSDLPTTKPKLIMPATMMSAVSTALPPTLSSFLKLNSSPSENRSTMIPICAQNSMLASMSTEGKNEKCGLAMKPATM